jgi:hypothetical protein
MPSTPAPLEQREAEAEALLFELIREIDQNMVDDVDFKFAESPRAYAFRALLKHWDRWPDDDVRWDACWSLLDQGRGVPEGGMIEQGYLACARAIELIGCSSSGNAPSLETVIELETCAAKIASIAAAIRVDSDGPYRGESTRWAAWEQANAPADATHEVEGEDERLARELSEIRDHHLAMAKEAGEVLDLLTNSDRKDG